MRATTTRTARKDRHQNRLTDRRRNNSGGKTHHTPLPCLAPQGTDCGTGVCMDRCSGFRWVLDPKAGVAL
jgi:hypothetical protein